MIAMDVEVDLADLRAEDPLQRHEAISSIVTSQPFWRAEAAISAPIQPEPTTTRRSPRSIRSPIARSRRGAQVVDSVELGARAHRGGGARRRLRSAAGRSPGARSPSSASSREPGVDRVTGSRSIARSRCPRRALGVDEGHLLGLAAQVVLGERRALVGSLGLVADQDQSASKPCSRRPLPPWPRPGRRRRSRMSDFPACLPPGLGRLRELVSPRRRFLPAGGRELPAGRGKNPAAGAANRLCGEAPGTHLLSHHSRDTTQRSAALAGGPAAPGGVRARRRGPARRRAGGRPPRPDRAGRAGLPAASRSPHHGSPRPRGRHSMSAAQGAAVRVEAPSPRQPAES